MQAPAKVVYDSTPGTSTYSAPNCSLIYDADWMRVKINRSPGQIAVGDECADATPRSPSVDPPACVDGAVCAQNADLSSTCSECTCGGLTPCYNTIYAQNNTLPECNSLVLKPQNGGTGKRWGCPYTGYNEDMPTKLCGEYPSVYPTITKPLERQEDVRAAAARAWLLRAGK
jgi:hypothetical protein